MSIPLFEAGSTHTVFKNPEKSAQGLIDALKGALDEGQRRSGGRVGVVADLVRGGSVEKPLIKGKVEGKKEESERTVPVGKEREIIVPRKGTVV
jgi:hypothetical protein